MDSGYSIIIPTMWKSDDIYTMLDIYEKSPYVKEIILIDNDPHKAVKLDYTKIKTFTKGKNIYVNPAWNWGASLAKYKIILANDDIIIRRLDEVFQKIEDSNFDIVGASVNQIDADIDIEDIDVFPRKSYGCFMYVKNYISIPEDLKIFRGDYLLFIKAKKRGILRGVNIETTVGKTIKSNSHFKKVTRNDKRLWKSKYKNL